jgi:hypothetical protein
MLIQESAGLASSPDWGPADRFWVFLDGRRLAAKAPYREGWISLDFLGFSRPHLYFSMGYADFSLRRISRALPRRGKPGTGALALADAEGGIGHEDKLSLTSDFPQEIVRSGHCRSLQPSEIVRK